MWGCLRKLITKQCRWYFKCYKNNINENEPDSNTFYFWIQKNSEIATKHQLNITSGNHMITSSNGKIFRVTALCAGNSPVTDEFPAQRPVTRSFDVPFDVRLNIRLSKQSWGRWFETTMIWGLLYLGEISWTNIQCRAWIRGCSHIKMGFN